MIDTLENVCVCVCVMSTPCVKWIAHDYTRKSPAFVCAVVDLQLFVFAVWFSSSPH